MVEPVAGIFIDFHFGIPEMSDAAILFRVRGPTICAIHEQGRAADAAPQKLYVFLFNIKWRPDPEIRVEFPGIGAVFILGDAVNGKVAGLFVI